MKIGLRVDVDTLRGTRNGVPNLLRIMDKYGIRAAFFFSLGPDNMGRNLWRLLKPTFLWKMLRTNAASLYGMDILLMGTAWHGPNIGRRCADVMRATEKAGHEIGLHAWDHYSWQAHVDGMSQSEIEAHLDKGHAALSEIIGRSPDCSAAPGWKCTNDVLLAKEKYGFRYNSDCRGKSLFMPVVNGRRLKTPQIPQNLPTYDELLGINGVTEENYNRRLLDRLNPDGMNLLTIHAEAEGGKCQSLFERFVEMARSEGHEFATPGELLPENVETLPDGEIAQGKLSGREGLVALQNNVVQ